jgi:hypothetical protein
LSKDRGKADLDQVADRDRAAAPPTPWIGATRRRAVDQVPRKFPKRP